MNFFIKISEYLFPLFLLSIILLCLFSKNDLIKSFRIGATDGVNAAFEIMPNILLIMTATALMQNTGALSFLVEMISPFLMKIKIPKGLCELIMIRPVSGSGAIVLLTNLYKSLGPDSYEGLIASVIAASTETTLYTISIYFGVTKVKKTYIPIIAGLAADLFTVLFSIFIINFLFYR